MTTATLAPSEQLCSGTRHMIHGNQEDPREMFPANVLPEMIYSPQHSMPLQHHYPNAMHALYVSHALPAVSIEGDGRSLPNMTNVSQPGAFPTMPVPIRPTVLYPGISSAPMYPTATRGSYCNTKRRQSGGSGEFSVVESRADDGSNDETNESGKVSQEVCRYFMRTGTCGYGDKCRYHHPQSAQRPKLNSMGYPQREAEHACPFYLKNGWCGFGATCKFNHPELPPLNVPTAAATTLVPQVLAPVPYQTIPHLPYANVSPGGHYSTVAPAQAAPVVHWPVTPAGVPMNVNPTPQSGMYQPYVSLPVQAWPPTSKDQKTMTLGSYGTPTTAPRSYQKSGDGHQEVMWRHTSPKSDDSAFSVVGRDVSIPRHQYRNGMESKHVLMPTIPIEDASHVSVTTA